MEYQTPTFHDLIDKVTLLEQEQASISKIQRQQLATLARLADLNAFISNYSGLMIELQQSQKDVMERCHIMGQKLDSLLLAVNE